MDFALKKSWQGAREDCRARGAELVSIHNPEEEMFLSKYSKGKTKWIGLSLNPVEGGQFVTTWKSHQILQILFTFALTCDIQ